MTLAAIYNFIGEPLFAHDPDHIEPCDDMAELDRRLGTPGLHDVSSAVRARTRQTILPPDLFRRYEREAFWQNRLQWPNAARVV